MTPDTYIIRRTDLALLDSQLPDKQVMTIVVEEGTSEVVVPLNTCHLPVLGKEQIASIGRLALALQKVVAWPVDVEWAYCGANLYLLQCRPMTTL